MVKGFVPLLLETDQPQAETPAFALQNCGFKDGRLIEPAEYH